MNVFDRKIGDLKLVSVETFTHMNVVVNSPTGATSLTQLQALQLRDALIEAYPVEPASAEYTIKEVGPLGWAVGKETASTYWKRAATCDTKEGATKVAQALNEAEGL